MAARACSAAASALGAARARFVAADALEMATPACGAASTLEKAAQICSSGASSLRMAASAFKVAVPSLLIEITIRKCWSRLHYALSRCALLCFARAALGRAIRACFGAANALKMAAQAASALEKAALACCGAASALQMAVLT